MRVVSCFDGISCGQVALQRAGFTPTTYFASEIDKYAITVTQRNWPETVQLGCIKNVVGMAASGLFGEVDLLMGGSPCQGFSNAGKGLGFVDPRSMLLYDFLMIKNFLQPKYFLLENVRMKKPDQDAISRMIGCEPIFINSADFSAQNRQRLYWTNIPVAAWADRGILLRDILEQDVPADFMRVDKKLRSKSNNEKAGTLTAGAHSGGNHSDTDVIAWQTNRDKSFCLDANYHKGSSVENYLAKSRRQMVFQVNSDESLTWRRLSVTECERLQTLPDGYTAGVSNTQRYKSIGNGWTVDVIAHILQGMHQC